MKPIKVSVAVDRPRDEVYEYLDVIANHEAFCDHFLTDWSRSGPAAGVGAKVRVKAKAPGPETWIDIEVIEAVPPVRTVERGTSAEGRRRTRGTYTLSELPGHRTLIEFELVYEATPSYERAALPLLRPWLRRANQRAMERLGEQLAPVGLAA
jgi:Polyketide cyclase / dehydrase and lipid transport